MALVVWTAIVFLHYGGADENAPLLFVVGVGVLVGLFLAWRRGRRDE
jgi:LPXTG-motif cell wall-anchored protein